jgi:hypothetical protein
MNIKYVVVSWGIIPEVIEEYFSIENCTNCDPISSFCEMINRVPICQCKNGYIKTENG